MRSQMIRTNTKGNKGNFKMISSTKGLLSARRGGGLKLDLGQGMYIVPQYLLNDDDVGSFILYS